MSTFLSNSPAPDPTFGSALPRGNDQKGCEPSNPPQTAEALAMIIITRPDATEDQIEHIVSRIHDWGLRAEVSRGEMRVVIGVIGPEDKIREKPLGAFPGLESVTPVLKPSNLVSYQFHPPPSKVKIGK